MLIAGFISNEVFFGEKGPPKSKLVGKRRETSKEPLDGKPVFGSEYPKS